VAPARLVVFFSELVKSGSLSAVPVFSVSTEEETRWRSLGYVRRAAADFRRDRRLTPAEGGALGNLLKLARRFAAGYDLRKFGRFYVRSSATVNGTPHCVQVTDGKEGSVCKLSLSSGELPFSERVVEGVWATVSIDENGRDWDTVFGSRAKPLVLAHLSWLREEFRSGVRALPWSPGCTDTANVDELIRVADLLFLSRVRGFLEVQRSTMADAAALPLRRPAPRLPHCYLHSRIRQHHVPLQPLPRPRASPECSSHYWRPAATTRSRLRAQETRVAGRVRKAITCRRLDAICACVYVFLLDCTVYHSVHNIT